MQNPFYQILTHNFSLIYLSALPSLLYTPLPSTHLFLFPPSSSSSSSSSSPSFSPSSSSPSSSLFPPPYLLPSSSHCLPAQVDVCVDGEEQRDRVFQTRTEHYPLNTASTADIICHLATTFCIAYQLPPILPSPPTCMSPYSPRTINCTCVAKQPTLCYIPIYKSNHSTPRNLL